MKVIITGITGLVGSVLLNQCIKDTRITSIVALSRRSLPAELSSDKKVKVIIHEDFLQYPAELLKELNGAEACLWAIGGKANDFPDVETAKKVQVDFTLAAANAFVEQLLPTLDGKTFNFVFCSGGMASRDQEKSLWILQDTRRLKGLAENGLIEIVEKNPQFKAYFMRPSHICPENFSVSTAILNVLAPSVKVRDLAAVMIETALKGGDEQTLENPEIVKKSTTLVEQI